MQGTTATAVFFLTLASFGGTSTQSRDIHCKGWLRNHCDGKKSGQKLPHHGPRYTFQKLDRQQPSHRIRNERELINLSEDLQPLDQLFCKTPTFSFEDSNPETEGHVMKLADFTVYLPRGFPKNISALVKVNEIFNDGVGAVFGKRQRKPRNLAARYDFESSQCAISKLLIEGLKEALKKKIGIIKERPRRAVSKYAKGKKTGDSQANLIATGPKQTLLDPKYRRKLFRQLPLRTQKMFRHESEKNVFLPEPELKKLLPTYGRNQIPNNRDGSLPSKKIMFSILLSSFHAYLEGKSNTSRPKRSLANSNILVIEASPSESQKDQQRFYFGCVLSKGKGCDVVLEAHCDHLGNACQCDFLVGRRRRILHRSFDCLSTDKGLSTHLPHTLSAQRRIRRAVRQQLLSCLDGRKSVDCDTYSQICLALLKRGDCSCFEQDDPDFCVWFESSRRLVEWALAQLTTDMDYEADPRILDFYRACAKRIGSVNCKNILEVCPGTPFRYCLCSEVISSTVHRTKSMKCTIPSPKQRYEASFDMETQCERLGGKDCKQTYGSCMGVPFPDCMCKIDLKTRQIGECIIFKRR